MTDSPETPKPPEESLNCSRRGRFIGGVSALLLTMFFVCFLTLLKDWNKNFWGLIESIFIVPFIVDIVTLPLGIYLGYKASRSQTTTIAFLQGAFISGLIAFIPLLPLFLLYARSIPEYLCIPFSLFIILVAESALVSGISAIYVRDYRKFQRKRWIPQFSLREMLICFTLISVVFAFLTVLTRLK